MICEAIEKLVKNNLSPCVLDQFFKEFGSLVDLKGCNGKTSKQTAEEYWTKLCNSFNNDEYIEDEEKNKILVAMEYDFIVSPYIGRSFDDRKRFYVWCLNQLSSSKI